MNRMHADINVNRKETRALLRLERTINLLCHWREGGREGGGREGGREGGRDD